MKDSDYKKTYKLFGLLILFEVLGLAVISVLAFVFSEISAFYSKLVYIFSYLWLAGVFGVIYKGEYVYWINGGPSYEEALKAGQTARKKYAGAYLKLFLCFILAGIVYETVSIIMGFGFVFDIVIFFIDLIIPAFLSIKIKFDK